MSMKSSPHTAPHRSTTWPLEARPRFRMYMVWGWPKISDWAKIAESSCRAMSTTQAGTRCSCSDLRMTSHMKLTLPIHRLFVTKTTSPLRAGLIFWRRTRWNACRCTSFVARTLR